MDAIKAVAEAAARTGTPTTHIGPMMGKTSAYYGVIASRGSTPKADTLAAMLHTMGYALVACPCGSVPPDGLEID